MQQTKQFKKNFIWNTLGLGFNSFNSLFFMIIVTRINGVDEAGIFTLAFSTACILYSVGIYAGRVYQVTELNEKISDKDFIVNRIITSVLMIILLVFFCIFKSYSIQKSIIFLLLTLYKAIEAFCDVLYGILQKKDDLDVTGKSLFIKAISSIIIFLISNIITKNVTLSIILMLIDCIVITVLYDFKKVYKYINFKVKVDWKNVFGIFKKGFFVFAISFLGMFILNVPKYSIDNYLTNNFQTIFGIIVMPATVVGLVAQFLIHPYLNQILDMYKKGDLKGFNKIVFKLILMIIIFGIVATILAYFIGTQVLGVIYGLDLSQYKIHLAIIIISATLYTIGTIYSSILTTVRQTLPQFIIYIGVAIIAYILTDLLTKNFELNGSVISYFVIMLMQSMAYTIYTNIKVKKIFNARQEIK